MEPYGFSWLLMPHHRDRSFHFASRSGRRAEMFSEDHLNTSQNNLVLVIRRSFDVTMS